MLYSGGYGPVLIFVLLLVMSTHQNSHNIEAFSTHHLGFSSQLQIISAFKKNLFRFYNLAFVKHQGHLKAIV